MKRTIPIILILALFVACGNSSAKRGASAGRNASVPDSPPKGAAVVVSSVRVNRLDTVAVLWEMMKEDVRSFFEGAEPATNAEVAERVSERYLPFSVTGEVTLSGVAYDYVINPVGAAILTPSSWDETSEELFFVNDAGVTMPDDDCSLDPEVKTISCDKQIYDSDDELGRWCRDWWLSATDVDACFKLCRPWDEATEGSVFTLFDNYNCELTGYLVMDGGVYRYSLWCKEDDIIADLCGEFGEHYCPLKVGRVKN